MKLNFDDVKETKIVPEGEAHLTIIGAKETKSSNGTNMLVLDMKDVEGGFLRDNVCLEGPGAFRAQQLFKALGIEPEDAETMEAADLIGQELEATIVLDEYNGTTRSKVKKYIA